jgi:hypothetical protein
MDAFRVRAVVGCGAEEPTGTNIDGERLKQSGD